MLRGQFGGETTFGGLGAGGEPTAVAVDVRPAGDRARRRPVTAQARRGSAPRCPPISRVPYYVRFTVADRRASSRRWRRCSRATTSTSTRSCSSPGFPEGRRPFVVSLDPAPASAIDRGDGRNRRVRFSRGAAGRAAGVVEPGARGRNGRVTGVDGPPSHGRAGLTCRPAGRYNWMNVPVEASARVTVAAAYAVPWASLPSVHALML